MWIQASAVDPPQTFSAAHGARTLHTLSAADARQTSGSDIKRNKRNGMCRRRVASGVELQTKNVMFHQRTQMMLQQTVRRSSADQRPEDEELRADKSCRASTHTKHSSLQEPGPRPDRQGSHHRGPDENQGPGELEPGVDPEDPEGLVPSPAAAQKRSKNRPESKRQREERQKSLDSSQRRFIQPTRKRPETFLLSFTRTHERARTCTDVHEQKPGLFMAPAGLRRSRCKRRETEKTTLFPGRFQAVSRPFPGRFQAVSRPFPGRFQAVSRSFSGRFQAVSRSFPGRFQELCTSR
ncbi:uncharacterized protein V6R79_022754 [Siganus canaliculatus]